MRGQEKVQVYTARRWFLLGLFSIGMAVLMWRVFDLQIRDREVLRSQGDARALRIVEVPAHRGVITDRNGEPLAISTPVESIWATPKKVLADPARLSALAHTLGIGKNELIQSLQDRIGREFVYLKRQVSPDEAAAVEALEIPGVHLQREYKRYYPSGEVTAHLIGFTNVDDSGQEGIELAYDDWLRGEPGSKQVLKDRLGHVVRNIESISAPVAGKPLTLSIDRRIQYLAYRELKAVVNLNKARSGTLVMLDAGTGEIMAMAVQPSYNPNNRGGLKGSLYRNRAVTDVFEPGSTMKPFTITMALMSGLYTLDSRIDTNPGYFRVSNHTIRDMHNYGVIDLTHVITNSSNVGAAKIALSLGAKNLWNIQTAVGFGEPTGSGFPGESGGLLNDYKAWSELDLASVAFGHSIAVTTLQLAQAYSIIAADGVLHPISLLKVDGPVSGQRVLPADTIAKVKGMMETVVREGGTGLKAAVMGYRVAGKTGTAHKATRGGYAEDRYSSLFAGIAPVVNSRLVMVVVIDEPTGSEHFGGKVAAPVFSKVMEGALRILNIPPDDLPSLEKRLIVAGQSNDSGAETL